jgi:6-pyruvoyltetrahydropterin/6-carboxytetrahydropterin synthase
MERYKVRVTKDYLTFCSAHFISFEGSQCERLHGHNYQVAAEIEGELDGDFLVFDFITLKHTLRDLTNELDHRMLVPLASTALRVEVGEKAVHIAHARKEWIFPRGDCALLPIENTTVELLARWIAGRLKDELARVSKEKTGRAYVPRLLRIEVEEAPGQSAFYETSD